MKGKRILALIGVILLLGMYAAAFLASLMGSPAANQIFLGSICATIIVPVLLYGYQLLYRVLKGRGVKAEQEEEATSRQDMVKSKAPGQNLENKKEDRQNP